jgi:hypothetical protein
VVRGCQAPKRISAKPGGARKRARLGFIERSCTSGLYSGSELRPMLRRVKHVEGRVRADLLTIARRSSALTHLLYSLLLRYIRLVLLRLYHKR